MAEIRLATLAMGTRFELIAFGPDAGALRAAGEAAIEAIDDAHRRLSRFEPSSLLSHIRRVGAGVAVPLDTDTFGLFSDALLVAQASDGAFDITLGTGGAERGIELEPAARAIRLRHAEVELDLGGIAKGHGIDLAARVLREAGVGSAFIHGGTSSGFAIGDTADGRPWRVALARDPAAPVVDLTDEGFSVSATLRPASIGSGPGPHLIDPRAGEVVTLARRAAVVGPSARLADAWTTALAMLGERPAALGPAWRVWLHDDVLAWRILEPQPTAGADVPF
jgi:thiamine biosynthesis lipoprotein